MGAHGRQPLIAPPEPERGPLKLYNYADYIGRRRQEFEKEYRSTSSRDVQLLRRGVREAGLRLGQLRRRDRPRRLEHRRPGGEAVLLPLNHNTSRTAREEHLARAAGSPSTTAGSRYTVPYVVWSDGIGWRNDKSRRTSARGRALGHLLESRPYRGKVGILDDKRDGLAMPMQRDAMHGRRPDLNTEDRRSSTRQARTSSS